MRRTYRSKRDAGGTLDHRDVLLNMDEKSSAFDAFYIQNIKQTKRELSCIGSSNAYGAASKKVRKRKYVKRIVKEVEDVQPRESMSSSTYLTPDKSIRVNKILDPFDQLLSSLTTDQDIAATKNNDIAKTKSKTYIRKKLTRVKKFNYSSEYSSESDKENTSNTESNTTDIRAHKLLVEIESENRPINFDESINRIFNNQSLINNFKRQNSSFNTSYKNNRSRLNNNCQSPILQRSPLCSTPFKDKYRGKSIYNFSPISTKEKESPNYVTIAEENNESNNSIVFLCKEKVPKLSKGHKSPQTCLAVVDKSIENIDNESMIYENEIEPQIDVCETENLEQEELKTNTSSKQSESVSTEQSQFQITEAEPFLGFSDDIVTECNSNDRKYLLKCIEETDSQNAKLNVSETFLDAPQNAESIDKTDSKREKPHHFSLDVERNLNENKSNSYRDIFLENRLEEGNGNISREISLENDSDGIEDGNKYESKCAKTQGASIISKEETNICDSSNSLDSDNESMYDTCESEQSVSEKGFIPLTSPRVFIERLNDSVFIRYHEKGKKEPKVSIERLKDSVFFKYYEKMLPDKSSSCDSNLTEGNQSDNDAGQTEADDTTSECYDSQDNIDTSQTKTDDTISEYNDSQNEVEKSLNEADAIDTNKSDDSESSSCNCSQNNSSSTSNKTKSDSVETQPNEIVITDSSTTEDVESNDETSNDEDETHVSFVTTRRRNEITNDSMFIFDNSFGSTSTECDKTVLSNKARLNCFDKSDLDISVINARTSDKSYFEPQEDRADKTQRNSRSSVYNSRPTRHSNVKSTDKDSSINEVTLIDEALDSSKMLINMSHNQTEKYTRSSSTTRNSYRVTRDGVSDRSSSINTEVKPSIVLQPGKKWERSLSIYRRMTTMADHFNQSLLEDEGQNKGRKYRQSVISTMEMQDSLHNESINSRRSTFISKPSRPTIRFVKDSSNSRISLNTTEVFDDLKGFLTEECDDTVIELSKLSLADSEFEVTVLDNFHETSGRIATARDYVLRRCNQTEAILFDECYPETVLKNCHKIGEGVYGEVFLWRGRDGRARVMKIVPIAGACKVNGEQQKDFHEVISEIVIAMELSALRAPIADIDRYFDEGKDVDALDLHSVENATDVFNEVLAVRCVQGPYPSRLLDLWELFDECKGSENDNPAALPADQQYMVLELANAGQDLESYQFTGAQQAHALFQQIAFGLAVGEESFQFEHRDLHWGNVLIASTEQKLATFVLRGRTYRVPRGGVAATIIDYSLSRISLPLAGERAALYNDLATDEQLFDAVGDYQFEVYRLMRDKLGNDWKNFEPYTNILWLHYTVDKMITALRYKRTTTKIHKHYIEKLKEIKEKILDYKSATEYVLTDIEI